MASCPWVAPRAGPGAGRVFHARLPELARQGVRETPPFGRTFADGLTGGRDRREVLLDAAGILGDMGGERDLDHRRIDVLIPLIQSVLQRLAEVLRVVVLLGRIELAVLGTAALLAHDF